MTLPFEAFDKASCLSSLMMLKKTIDKLAWLMEEKIPNRLVIYLSRIWPGTMLDVESSDVNLDLYNPVFLNRCAATMHDGVDEDRSRMWTKTMLDVESSDVDLDPPNPVFLNRWNIFCL